MSVWTICVNLDCVSFISYVNYIKACTNFNGQVINLTKGSKSTFTFAHFVYTVMAELLKNNFFSSNVYIRFHKQKERQLDGYSSVLVSLHRCGWGAHMYFVGGMSRGITPIATCTPYMTANTDKKGTFFTVRWNIRISPLGCQKHENFVKKG